VSGTAAQLAYNRVKGSVPVLRQLSATQLRSLDACARESWQTFASPLAVRLPNLGMATDKATRDAVMQTLWHYVNEPDLDVAEVQRQLASIFQQPTHRTSP
jgi:glucose/mannose transport system substrate-binding protein